MTKFKPGDVVRLWGVNNGGRWEEPCHGIVVVHPDMGESWDFAAWVIDPNTELGDHANDYDRKLGWFFYEREGELITDEEERDRIWAEYCAWRLTNGAEA